MKKLTLTLAAALLAASLAACGSAPSSSAPSSSASSSSAPASSAPSSSAPASQAGEAGDVTMASSLEEIMDAVLASVPEDQLPMMMPADLNGGSKYTPLTEENSEYSLGVARDAYAEGIAAESAISAVAHSVCLVRAASADEAAQLAADIEANANPNKWICVGAESKIVKQSGDVVILIMTGADLADQLAAGFDAIPQ